MLVTEVPPVIPLAVTVEPIIIPTTSCTLVIISDPSVNDPVFSYTCVWDGKIFPSTVRSVPTVKLLFVKISLFTNNPLFNSTSPPTNSRLLSDTSSITVKRPFNDMSSANINV